MYFKKKKRILAQECSSHVEAVKLNSGLFLCVRPVYGNVEDDSMRYLNIYTYVINHGSSQGVFDTLAANPFYDYPQLQFPIQRNVVASTHYCGWLMM